MKYHKIQTVFKRDPDNKHKTLLIGEYSTPEFEYLENARWIWTEKVDGTNIRIIWDGNKITYCGKSGNSQIPASLYRALSCQFLGRESDFMEKFLESDVTLYGEGYGAKIQKGGGDYRQDPGFILFDVNVDGMWLRREDVEDVARTLNIDIVRVIGDGNLTEMVDFAKHGFYSEVEGCAKDKMAEGIVARPEVELQTRRGERIITKIKYKDFEREAVE